MSNTSEMQKPKAGEVSWNELMTTSAKGAAEFYGKLFGWQATPFTPPGGMAGDHEYNLFKLDPNSMGVGGMMQAPDPKIPSHWVPYVVVEDIDASLAKATKLGAKTCLPVTSIGEIGRIAVIQDPQGATVGLHELAK